MRDGAVPKGCLVNSLSTASHSRDWQPPAQLELPLLCLQVDKPEDASYWESSQTRELLSILTILFLNSAFYCKACIVASFYWWSSRRLPSTHGAMMWYSHHSHSIQVRLSYNLTHSESMMVKLWHLSNTLRITVDRLLQHGNHSWH